MNNNRSSSSLGYGWIGLYLLLAVAALFTFLPGKLAVLERRAPVRQARPSPSTAAPAGALPAAPTPALSPTAAATAAPGTATASSLPGPSPATPAAPALVTITPADGARTAVVTPTSVATPAQEDVVLAHQLFQLVNALRQEEGCPTLRIAPLLRQTALGHAHDLAQRRTVDHIGSDGSTLRQRLERSGYPFQLHGENIAAGYRTPEKVMSMWTTGDEYPAGPHRKNILNCRYSEAGVGLARAADGYPYWVLDLASRR